MKAGLNCCLQTLVERENHMELMELLSVSFGGYTMEPDQRCYWKRKEETAYVLNTYYVLDAFVYPIYFSQ